MANVNRVSDLLAQRGALIDSLDGLVDKQVDYDRAEAQIGELDGQIARAKKAQELSAAAALPYESRAGGAAAADAPKFRNLGQQLQAIVRADAPSGRAVVDERLQRAPTGLNETVADQGGFLIQPDFITDLIQNMWDQGEIASRVRKITVGPNSNGIVMNGVDEVSRANGLRNGGIMSFWTAEAGLKIPSMPKFKRVQMNLEKLVGLLYATDELLADDQALTAWIKMAFQEEFDFRIDDAIINGSGTGMPLGILNSGATITVQAVSGQPTHSVVAANVLSMWARLPARSRNNAVWLINQDTEPQLLQFFTPVYNGSNVVAAVAAPQVIYTPPGVNGSTYGMLMGRPVIPSEVCATAGTAGDLILADLTQYLAIDKGGVEEAMSIHVRFIYDESVFRFVYRFNGQPIWYTPVIPYKGTATQSPFVILANR